MLDDKEDCRLLHGAAEQLARAEVPASVLAAIRVGRIAALRKPNGRVRALIVGDVLRRLVGRVMANLIVCPTTAGRLPPFSVRAAHVRWHGSCHAPAAHQDADGVGHVVHQGERGEQGDPLMPALYALAPHPALVEVQDQLLDGEALFAFLDDIYIVANPERVRPLLDALSAALWEHAHVQLRAGKTRIWNAAGGEPPSIADLTSDVSEVVWVGDWSLPPAQQGLLAFGAPLGHEA